MFLRRARLRRPGVARKGGYTRRQAWSGTTCCAAALGCRQDMHDQPRYEPFEKSAFFADGRSSRLQVPGTVARGQLQTDDHFYRGHERFVIFCSPCHGRLGDGEGIVAQRGFHRPPSYHSERLRAESVGHFFDVGTNGLGAMSDFSDRIPPRAAGVDSARKTTMGEGVPLFSEQASTIAEGVDQLYVFLVGVSGFFSVLIFVLIFFFASRYRRRSDLDMPRPALRTTPFRRPGIAR